MQSGTEEWGWSSRAPLVRWYSGPCMRDVDAGRVFLFEAFRRARTTCWDFRRDVLWADRGQCDLNGEG